MRKLLIFLLAFLALPTAVNAFWGLSKQEKTICRDRDAREKINLVRNKHIIIAQKI